MNRCAGRVGAGSEGFGVATGAARPEPGAAGAAIAAGGVRVFVGALAVVADSHGSLANAEQAKNKNIVGVFMGAEGWAAGGFSNACAAEGRRS
ncbi:MAG: hypothetical protein RLZZ15_24 [Verrucomicrobiota bacterium]